MEINNAELKEKVSKQLKDLVGELNESLLVAFKLGLNVKLDKTVPNVQLDRQPVELVIDPQETLHW